MLLVVTVSFTFSDDYIFTFYSGFRVYVTSKHCPLPLNPDAIYASETSSPSLPQLSLIHWFTTTLTTPTMPLSPNPSDLVTHYYKTHCPSALTKNTTILSLLILLDLTAAFHTISTILLFCLQTSLNITGCSALSWLQSYLTNRQSSVQISPSTSTTASSSTFSPSVPSFITMASISNATLMTSCLSTLTACLNSSYVYKLTHASHHLITSPSVSTILPSSFIHHLCIIFNNNLSFKTQISSLTQAAFFQLKNITCLCPCFYHLETGLN